MHSLEKKGCLAGLLKLFISGKKLDSSVEADSLPYLLRDDFFSQAEGSFFRVLKEVCKGDFIICPKVSLKEIFFVSRPNENMAFYNRIDRKHVDFLLCDVKTLKPAMGIELDDVTHKRPDRRERDEFMDKVFEGAGIQLVRVPAKAAYSTQELHGMIYSNSEVEKSNLQDGSKIESLVPLCPKCGVEMVLRTATRGAHKGKQFFGCPNYPRCREFRAAYQT